jgi:kynurenine formamidase
MENNQPQKPNFLPKLFLPLLIITFLLVAIVVPLVSQGQKQTAPDLTELKAIDLTHVMHNDMAFWPGGVPFTMTKLVDYDSGYLLYKFEMGENTGTHVDAPAHFIQGNKTIDQIPLSDFIVPTVVIDIQNKTADNPDYQLSAADVTAWEEQYGTIPPGTFVILNTGWHKRFDNPTEYINMDPENTMHFPGYGSDSAQLLLERNVAGIGIDTLSIDYGASQDFGTHGIMLQANKYQIENMANLDALPPTGATLVIGVLPVKDGSQAQARIFAFLP